jgi:hypothetical protein
MDFVNKIFGILLIIIVYNNYIFVYGLSEFETKCKESAKSSDQYSICDKWWVTEVTESGSNKTCCNVEHGVQYGKECLLTSATHWCAYSSSAKLTFGLIPLLYILIVGIISYIKHY